MCAVYCVTCATALTASAWLYAAQNDARSTSTERCLEHLCVVHEPAVGWQSKATVGTLFNYESTLTVVLDCVHRVIWPERDCNAHDDNDDDDDHVDDKDEMLNMSMIRAQKHNTNTGFV